MSPSRILLASCLFFIGGVAVASLTFFNQIIVLVAFIIGTFLLTIFWAHKRLVLVGMCIVAGALGITAYQNAASEVIQEKEREVSLIARVVEEPEIRENSVQLVVRQEGVSQGNILVTTSEFSDYQYGDRLHISGKLAVPKAFDDFNYQEFLGRQGIYSLLYTPEIELLERGAYTGPHERAFVLVLELKHKFRDVLHEHIRPPQSTILGAIVLGDKSALQDDTKEKLNASGLRHVTAISGMHVGVLTILLMRFLIWAGLWRQQAFYATIVLMLLFIVMTGLQPSAIRAGIMGGMFLLGQHIGRVNVSWRALIFAATGMLAFNPLLLGDVGFQLSFLAVLGIIYFLPIFQYLSRKIPKKLHDLRDIIGMTIAAQILTLPILIFTFGYVSLVSVVTNVLVVPMLPFLLVFGFIFLIGGSLWGALGFLLSLPVFFFLSYLTFIIDFSSQLPFAAVRTENFPIALLLFLYIPIVLFYWKFRKRQDPTFIP